MGCVRNKRLDSILMVKKHMGPKAERKFCPIGRMSVMRLNFWFLEVLSRPCAATWTDRQPVKLVGGGCGWGRSRRLECASTGKARR